MISRDHQAIRSSTPDASARKLLLGVSLLPLLDHAAFSDRMAVRSWPILAARPLMELLTGQVWKPFQGEFGFYLSSWDDLGDRGGHGAGSAALPAAAIYLSEYARTPMKTIIKPLMDLLAAIPSVVYGVWGMVAIVPWVQNSLAPSLERLAGFHTPLCRRTTPPVSACSPAASSWR